MAARSVVTGSVASAAKQRATSAAIAATASGRGKGARESTPWSTSAMACAPVSWRAASSTPSRMGVAPSRAARSRASRARGKSASHFLSSQNPAWLRKAKARAPTLAG